MTQYQLKRGIYLDRVEGQYKSVMIIKPLNIDFWLHLLVKGSSTVNTGLTTAPSPQSIHALKISTKNAGLRQRIC